MPPLCHFTPIAPRAVPGLTLIGLTGTAGAGKDTVGEHLTKMHGYEPYSFAGPLKAMLEALCVELGVDYAHIHERKLKEQPIARLGGVSARQLMQTLGTEWARQHLHQDFWLHAAALVLGLPDAPVHDRIVITDVRFPNEAEFVRAWGGIVVRIIRPANPFSAASHASEQLVDGIAADAVILNDGGMGRLWDQVNALAADRWNQVDALAASRLALAALAGVRA